MKENNVSMSPVSAADAVGGGALMELKNAEDSMFCTIRDDGTRTSKAAIYNAISGKCEQLSDHIGEEILLVDVAAHNVNLTDPQTGELVNLLRVVLVAANGKRYQAVSKGVVSALARIFAVFGTPHYDDALPVVADEVKTSKGYKVLTLSVKG